MQEHWKLIEALYHKRKRGVGIGSYSTKGQALRFSRPEAMTIDGGIEKPDQRLLR